MPESPYLQQTRKRQKQQAERLRALVLNDQQQALAGDAIAAIKDTPGFQILLEMFESIIQKCGSTGIAEVATLDAGEAHGRANYWYGYESCALHFLQDLDHLVGIRERYSQNKKLLDDKVSSQIFRGMDPIL